MLMGAMSVLAGPYLASFLDGGYKYAGYSIVWNYTFLAAGMLFMIGVLLASGMRYVVSAIGVGYSTIDVKTLIGLWAGYTFTLGFFVLGYKNIEYYGMFFVILFLSAFGMMIGSEWHERGFK